MRGAFFEFRAMQQNYLLTPEGIDELKKELNDLQTVRRPNAVKRVTAAREQGDLSENSEYTAAREDLDFIDDRIAELEEILRVAKPIASGKTNGKVQIGSTVVVELNGKTHEFMIVGEPEANPVAKKISQSSPLGKALMGKTRGDAIEVAAPAGTMVYKIVEIR